MSVNENTMVITTWYVEHEDEFATVFLNDCTLGDWFGGRAGFEAKLADQGFRNIRLLTTPEELQAAKPIQPRKRLGSWGGPWRTKYDWEHWGSDVN